MAVSGIGEEMWNEYGIAQSFIHGDFFKGFQTQVERLVHVAWFETVYESDHRPGGILVKGPRLRRLDQHISVQELTDTPCTINPKRHRKDPSDKDFFFYGI